MQKLSDGMRRLLDRVDKQPCTKDELSIVERSRLFSLLYMGYVSGNTKAADVTVFSITSAGRKALRG